MLTIINEHIVLKPLSLEDSSDIFQVINNEREYLRQWLPFVDASQEEQTIKEYIEGVLGLENTPQFTIYEHEEFIGLVGFKDNDTLNQKIEIGYWLSEKAQGRGIMTAAVATLLDLAFTTLGLNRVQIKVAVANKKSSRIPERLGFSLEGIERDGELLVDGVFTDLAIYSLLRREYQPSIDSRDN